MSRTAGVAPVLAFDSGRANNADLIAHAADLGYLHTDWPTLDCTYGLGRFWTRFRPATFFRTDLNPARSPDLGISIDFREMPFDDEHFRAVVLDPPYKLNGTSTGAGVSSSDDDYGVENYSSVADRHQLICDGITECVRVLRTGDRNDRSTGGYLLVKCMDQVNGGRVRWQTRLFADHAEAAGCRLVDQLHLPGYRAQPAGRSQQHARRNYSTLLVLRKEA